MDFNYVVVPAIIPLTGILIVWLSIRCNPSLSAKSYRRLRRVTERIILSSVVLVAAGVAGSAPVKAIPGTASTPVAFDVASIRQSAPSENGTSFSTTADGYTARSAELCSLIQAAYGKSCVYGPGLPKWVKNAHFDVTAKLVDRSESELEKITDAQKMDMLKATLQDRFKLQTHNISKRFPAYEMVVAKGGLKLKEIKQLNGGMDSKADRDEVPLNQSKLSIDEQGLRTFSANGYGPDCLISEISYATQRLVIDKTNSNGKYNIVLRWAPDATDTDNSSRLPSGASIFDALREQLGIELKSTMVSLDVVVIDHAEMPTN
jgi:uncharacterized protein (TIGR03435 family)